MYIQALKQRQFYIDTFGLHRFKMIDYYKVLGCVALFWFEPAEPVVCSECGDTARAHMRILDATEIWRVECRLCGNTGRTTDGIYKRYARTKRQAIKRWNKLNCGMVCDIRSD